MKPLPVIKPPTSRHGKQPPPPVYVWATPTAIRLRRLYHLHPDCGGHTMIQLEYREAQRLRMRVCLRCLTEASIRRQQRRYIQGGATHAVEP